MDLLTFPLLRVINTQYTTDLMITGPQPKIRNPIDEFLNFVHRFLAVPLYPFKGLPLPPKKKTT